MSKGFDDLGGMEEWRAERSEGSCSFSTNAAKNPVKIFDKLTKGNLTCKHKILN